MKRGRSTFYTGKKAQITVFIIVGLIILFGAGTALYMRQQGIGPTKILQPKTPPVEQYIMTCMERTAEDAIRAMGTQGGFIELPIEFSANPARTITLIPGVPSDLAPKVPYWYWEGKTEIPSLLYMETEVEGYIKDNLPACINNFEAFEDEYNIMAEPTFEPDVVFADKDTVVGLNWHVEIQQKGSEEVTKKDNFIVNLDVKVKRMWELAKELLDAENENEMFEEMTINFMASHPEKDIPFDSMTFSCGREVWHLEQIKKKLAKGLESQVMGIRFRNTDHPPFLENDDTYTKIHQAVQAQKESKEFVPLVLPKTIPADSYEYFQLYFNFTNKDYSDLKVTANYRKDWGMNIMSTPSQYGVMKSGVQDLKSKILTFLCLNTYHFVYDVYYPVMISINDPKAFRGKSYVFRYAFPVSIYHNDPDRSPMPAIEFNPQEFDLDFCEFYGNDEHTIRAIDAITNAELSKVNLTYRCYKYACDLGRTRTNNQHLQWSGNFPTGCANPLIEAKKDGYITTEVQYGGSEPFEFKMYPTQDVKFTIRKNREDSPGVSRFLQPDEHAVISIEHKDPDLSLFYTFSADETFNSKQVMGLLQDDATYDLNIMLFKRISDDEDVMIGGYIGPWDVKYSEIADADKVEFHVFQKFPIPQTDQDFVDMYQAMSNTTKYPEIRHIFKKAGDAETPSEAEGGTGTQ